MAADTLIKAAVESDVSAFGYKLHLERFSGQDQVTVTVGDRATVVDRDALLIAARSVCEEGER